MNRTQLPLTEIKVLDRQRIEMGDIADLADSIQRHGLIHPIVINQDKRLIAGGRRYAAHQYLGRIHIDVVYMETMSTDQLHELELEENVRRHDMTWQERCLTIDKIHALKKRRSALEAAKWGVRETGEMIGLAATRVQYNLEIAAKLRNDLKLPEDKRRYWQCGTFQDAWRLRMRDEEEAIASALALEAQFSAVTGIAPAVADSSALGGLLDDLPATPVASLPEAYTPPTNIASTAGHDLTDVDLLARREADRQAYESFVTRIRTKGFASLSELEAEDFYRLLTPKPEDSFIVWYEKRKAMVEPWLSIPLSQMLHNTSCLDWMGRHPESVDHIITDPPYGIEMSNLEQQNTGMSDIDTVAAEHDVKSNEDLLAAFICSAYACLKPNGYLVLWCDQMQWQFLYNQAINVGFKVQRWPITWVKTHRCMNQAAQFNFTKTTEIAMVCRKGSATLVAPAGECHILAAHDDLKEKLGHPFVKPFAVWEFIHKHVSFEGQTILEPFAGRGSGVVSALALKRKVIACELNTAHYNALVENIKQHYLSINPRFTFR